MIFIHCEETIRHGVRRLWPLSLATQAFQFFFKFPSRECLPQNVALARRSPTSFGRGFVILGAGDGNDGYCLVAVR